MPFQATSVDGSEIALALDSGITFATEKNDIALVRGSLIFFLKTGEVAVPPFTIKSVDGTEIGKTNSFTVQVVGPGQNSEELKPYDPLMLRFPRLWIWGGVLAALLILGGIVYALVRYSRRNSALAVVDLRTPTQKVLDEIRKLEGIPSFQERKYKALCHLLSDRLKTYLSFAYGIPAEESTTTELFQRLDGKLIASQNGELRSIFQVLDLVKFTDFAPTEDEIRAVHSQLVAFITASSTPVSPEPVLSPGEAK